MPVPPFSQSDCCLIDCTALFSVVSSRKRANGIAMRTARIVQLTAPSCAFKGDRKKTLAFWIPFCQIHEEDENKEDWAQWSLTLSHFLLATALCFTCFATMLFVKSWKVHVT